MRTAINYCLLIIVFVWALWSLLSMPEMNGSYPEKIVLHDRSNKCIVEYYGTLFVYDDRVEIGDATEYRRVDTSMMTE